MQRINKALVTLSVALIITAPSQMASADEGNGDSIYTAWAFIFNNPEYCVGPCDGPDLANDMVEGAVIYLTGQRVQSNGRAIFAGPISAGSNHRQIGGSSMMGLVNPLTAEIHVGLQNHQKSSLDGDAGSRHNQATNPCGPPCALVQAAAFLPGESVGDVHFWGTDTDVPGATATMTREGSGVSITIDTSL